VTDAFIGGKYKCPTPKLMLLLFVVWMRVTWDNFWARLVCSWNQEINFNLLFCVFIMSITKYYFNELQWWLHLSVLCFTQQFVI